MSVSVWLIQGDPGLFASGILPVIDVGASDNTTLLFVLAPYMYGNATFNVSMRDSGGTARGGQDTALSNRSFTICVLPINHPPVFSLLLSQFRVYENSGYHSFNMLNLFNKGSPNGNEENQTVSFIVTQLDCIGCVSSMFSSGPEILLVSADLGLLVFNLSRFENGQAKFNVSAVDNGGTDRGGVNQSKFQSFVIIVVPVNNPPVFHVKSNEIVEDETNLSGQEHVLVNFVYGINAGSPNGNENYQTLTFSVFHVETRSPAFFEIEPAIQFSSNATSANLTFTLLPFVYGNVSFFVMLMDSGPEPNVAISTIEFSINFVNQPPTFVLSNPTVTFFECGVNDPDLNKSVPAFITHISKGSPNGNQNNQRLTSFILGRGEQGGLSAGPVIVIEGENGTLDFALERYFFGNLSFVVWLENDGGRARHGSNQSNSSTFVIQIVHVNQPPTFMALNSVVVMESGKGLIPDFAYMISRGSPTGNEDFQAVSFVVIQTSGNNLMFLVKPHINITGSTGTLEFVLNGTWSGNCTFMTYLEDNGGTANGGSNVSSSRSFTLSVLFVNHAPEFEILEHTLRVKESLSESLNTVYNNFIQVLTKGDEHEGDQLLRFETLWNFSGFDDVTIVIGCYDMISYDRGGLCKNNSAFLLLRLPAYRWGSFLVNVRVQDNGGRLNGGNDTSKMESFQIEVLPVNEPPSFEISSPLLFVLENCGGTPTTALWDMPLSISIPVCAPGLDYSLPGFATGISMGMYEDDSAACQIHGVQCENQTGTFFLYPADVLVASSLFSAAPTIDLHGMLKFSIRSGMTGSSNFSIVLTDGDALDGTQKNSSRAVFIITILFVNKPPSFNIFDRFSTIVVCENSGNYSARVISNITDGESGQNNMSQKLTFVVMTTPEYLFERTGLPMLSDDGLLVFTPCNFCFGTAKISVYLIDDGGVLYGGRDRSDLANLSIIIRPINQPPTFEIAESIAAEGILLQEGEIDVSVPGVIVNISSGPGDEGCDPLLRPSCEGQNVSFRVDWVMNGELFLLMPHLSAEGTLLLRLAPNATGTTSLALHLEDDGADFDTHMCNGSNTSAMQVFRVTILPTSAPPAFQLYADFDCPKSPNSTTCACRPELVGSNITACRVVNSAAGCPTHSKLPTGQVRIGEGSDVIPARGFIVASTSARGFLPSSASIFEASPTGGSLRLLTAGTDQELGAAIGLEQAVAEAYSADGRFLYVGETETDTVAVFALSQGGGQPAFVDRRGAGERRFRLNSLGLAELGTGVLVPEAVCGLDAAQGPTGQSLVMAAAGCAGPLPQDDPPVGQAAGLNSYQLPDALIKDTVGMWDFVSTATVGPMTTAPGAFPAPEVVVCGESGCSYSRPRDTANCREAVAPDFAPAAFRDMAGGIGAAVLPGPACVSGSQEDWAAGSGKGLSVLTFMAFSGDGAEALRFDGTLNSGLWVARSLDAVSSLQEAVAGVSSIEGLPRDGLGLAVWFTVESAGGVPYAALAAALRTDPASGCTAGWSLGYSVVPSGESSSWSVVVQFRLAVEGGGGKAVTVSGALPLSPAGRWHHVVASYDGTAIALRIDGSAATRVVACAVPPCGRITYPTEVLDARGTGGCPSGRAPFTIGTLVDAAGEPSPHRGSLRSLRIVRRALSDEEGNALLAELAGLLPDVMLNEYWAASAPLSNGCPGGPCPLSPDADYADAAVPRTFKLLGLFSSGARYRCRFNAGSGRIMDSVEDATLSCGADGCVEQSYDTLACNTPRWVFGFRLAEVSLMRFTSSINTTSNNKSWVPVWRRICLEPACGFVLPQQRGIDGSPTLWWMYGQLNLLYPGLTGALAQIRFIVASTIYLLAQGSDSDDDNQVPALLKWSGSMSCADPDMCGRVYGKRTCVNAAAAGRPCTANSDCVNDAYLINGGVCAPENAFAVKGASSMTAFSLGNRTLLAVANFWDGAAMGTTSALLTLASNGTIAHVQDIQTAGARQWLSITLNNLNGTGCLHFLAVANAAGPSLLYRLRVESGEDLPIDEATSVPFWQTGARALVAFDVSGISYLAVASASPATATLAAPLPALMRLGVRINATHVQFGHVIELAHASAQENASVGAPVVMPVQEFPEGQGAVGVACLVAGSKRILVFAVSGASPVYIADATAAKPAFALAQRVVTSRSVTSVRALIDQYGSYVLIAQAGNHESALLLRWNGSAFLGPVNPTTARADLAGGQNVMTSGASTVLLLPAFNIVNTALCTSSITTNETTTVQASTTLRIPASTTAAAAARSSFASNASTTVATYSISTTSRLLVTNTSANVTARNSSSSDSGVALLLATAFWNSSLGLPVISCSPPLVFGVQRETIGDLTRPAAIALNLTTTAAEDQGSRLYVGLGSGGIAVFDIDPASGDIAYNCPASLGPGPGPEVPQGGWLPATCVQVGSPFRTIVGLVLSADGRHLYAGSSWDGAIAVFEVDAANGGLHLKQVLLDGCGVGCGGILPLPKPGILVTTDVPSLLDVRGLAASADGTAIFAAGGIAAAIVEFNRDPTTGILALADAVYEGERLVGSFQNLMPAPELGEPRPSSSGGGLPARLGGDTVPWALAARAAAAADIRGMRIAAVAAGFAAFDGPGAALVAVYAWNSTGGDGSGGFNLLQTLECVGAASLAFFWVQPAPGVAGNRLHLLAAGRALSAGTYAGDDLLRVFIWNFSHFSLYQKLASTDMPLESSIETTSQANRTSANNSSVVLQQSIEINALATLSCDGSIYLAAAATLGDGATSPAFVRVYRWNWALSVLVPHQDLPAFGATDVCAWPNEVGGGAADGEINDGAGCFFVFADGGAEASMNGPGAAAVVVYVLHDNGNFTLLQQVQLRGAYGVALFRAARGARNLFLSVAQRMARATFAGGDYTAYDQPSALLRWNMTTGQFEFWQNISSEFSSVPEDGNAPEDVAAFGVLVGGLRGATRMAAFESAGETYVAVAQSLCSSADGSVVCASRFPAQPRSAVLQLDATTGQLTDLLPYSPLASAAARRLPLSEAEQRRIGRAAMRFDAGRATDLLPIFISNGRIIILACSLTQGAIAFEWAFDQVVGLGGASAVAVDPTSRAVYILSPALRAITRFARGNGALDGCGQVSRSCPPGSCLLFVPAASFSDTKSTCCNGNGDGGALLAGGRSITVIDSPSCRNGTGFCTVVVRGGLPRDERLCGPMPLTPPSGWSATIPPPCQVLNLTLSENANTSEQSLLATPPAVSADGTLFFTSAQYGATGEENFTLRLTKKGKEVNGGTEFGNEEQKACARVVVDIVPEPEPTNVTGIVNLTVVDTNGVQIDLVFASSIGPPNSDWVLLGWDAEFDHPELFAHTPAFLLKLQTSSIFAAGVIRLATEPGEAGSANFHTALRFIGPTWGVPPSPAFADFTITVLTYNRPPSFVLADGVAALIGGTALLVPEFATAISPGLLPSEAAQQYTFFLHAVSFEGASETPAGLFAQFIFDANGTLQFAIAAIAQAGTYIVSVGLRDNGGTANGGSDTSYSTFVLTALAVPLQPPQSVSIDLGAAMPEVQQAILPTPASAIFPFLFPTALALVGVGPQPPPIWKAQFIVAVLSDVWVFASLPRVDSTGTLFILPSGAAGTANLSVVLLVGSPYHTSETAAEWLLEVNVWRRNTPPSFELADGQLLASAGGGPVIISGFVKNLTAGFPAEAWQHVSLRVAVEGGPAASVLFSNPPALDADGTLTFQPAVGRFGEAVLVVWAIDNGGIADGGNDTSRPQRCSLTVLPAPVVSSVLPALGPANGGFQITIWGAFFESGTSFTAEAPSVWLGVAPCTAVVLESDSKIVCTAPAAATTTNFVSNNASGVDVRVQVGVRELRRVGILSRGFAYAAVYLVGSVANKGFFGLWPGAASLYASAEPLTLLGAARTAAPFGGGIAVGGSFSAAEGAKDGARHIVLYQGGVRPVALGSGLDGAVLALAAFNGLLFAGGAFTIAFADDHRPSVSCPGLCSWDGSKWAAAGAGAGGRVRSLVMYNSWLIAAGDLSPTSLGGVAALNVEGNASFSRMWASVGGGVGGGRVLALTVWGQVLVAVGSFVSAGDSPAGGVALWDGREWAGLGDLDGPARAVTALGDTLFVGGAFTTVGSVPAAGLARYSSGRWYAVTVVTVGNSPLGSFGVLSLTTVNGCSFAGSSVPPFAAGWCPPSHTGSNYAWDQAGNVWSAVVGAPGPVHALSLAIPQASSAEGCKAECSPLFWVASPAASCPVCLGGSANNASFA